MHLTRRLRPWLVAAALLAPACAHATSFWLDFTGVVSPGSSGDVFPRNGDDFSTTSFDGKPVTLKLHVIGVPAHQRLDYFAASWSDQTYGAPFITSWSDPVIPNTPANDDVLGFVSTVAMNSNGGSISIRPTFLFQAETDGGFGLNGFSFNFSSPHNLTTAFVDNGVTGGGALSASLNFAYSPQFNEYYDAGSNLSFALTGVSLAPGGAPEPSTWAVMLVGFAGLGAGLRRQRALRAAVS